MKKIILKTVAAIAILYSCNSRNSSNEKVVKESSSDSIKSFFEAPIPEDSVLNDSDLGKEKIELYANKKIALPTNAVTVEIDSLKGYGQDSAFAFACADTLKAVLNSAGFKKAVLNTAFDYYNRGLTSQQIYDVIMNAHEENGPGGTDKVVDLRLRTITLAEDGQRWINACKRTTIGIDGAGSGMAAVCPDWLRYTAQNKHYSWLAAHFIHEYMHILGFTHPNHKSMSVPYKIHEIVETLAEDPKLL